jgi:hypothetical protein
MNLESVWFDVAALSLRVGPTTQKEQKNQRNSGGFFMPGRGAKRFLSALYTTLFFF